MSSAPTIRLLLLGPPGAGKGTVAAVYSERTAIPHLSTGDMFRAAIRAGTTLGKRVEGILKSGSLVPDAVTVDLVRTRLEEPDMERGYILDGFPRTLPQAEALARFSNPDAAINLIVSEQLIVRRLSGRRVCGNDGSIYHVYNNPPRVTDVCDRCGRPLLQRADDEPRAIRRRIEVYHQESAPLVRFYRERGVLHDVDGSIDPAAVCDLIDAIVAAPRAGA